MTPSPSPNAVRVNPWVRRYHPAPGAPVRLVYFPHAGGTASSCFQLSAALPPAIEVLALQYPGRQDRFTEPCVESVAEFADEIHRALDGLDDKPLAFFGHSMGATLAYEVARRFQAGASPAPVRLFASGRRAPSIVHPERVHLGGDSGLIAEVRGLAGTDAGILADDDLLELILPAMRADYRAIETYAWTPGPPLTCPVTVLIGDHDPRVDLAEASAWQQHTSGEFTLRVLPGDHFYLGEGALGVADLLRDELAAYARV